MGHEGRVHAGADQRAALVAPEPLIWLLLIE
jgi:hypothetical protein